MKYPLIIALDPFIETHDYLNWSIDLINKTHRYITGYKIGLPLIIKTNTSTLEKIVEYMRSKGIDLIIADLKLADIGEVMVESIKPLVEIGIDTFIAHSFIGYRGGLNILVDYLKKNKCRLVTILSMTHPGSREIIDRNINELIEVTLEVKPWGVVVAAYKKEIIEKIIELRKNKELDLKILTPGIGVQGTEPGTGLRNGADYEIIGRLITTSTNPEEKLVELINKYYRWIK